MLWGEQESDDWTLAAELQVTTAGMWTLISMSLDSCGQQWKQSCCFFLWYSWADPLKWPDGSWHHGSEQHGHTGKHCTISVWPGWKRAKLTPGDRAPSSSSLWPLWTWHASFFFQPHNTVLPIISHLHSSSHSDHHHLMMMMMTDIMSNEIVIGSDCGVIVPCADFV